MLFLTFLLVSCGDEWVVEMRVRWYQQRRVGPTLGTIYNVPPAPNQNELSFHWMCEMPYNLCPVTDEPSPAKPQSAFFLKKNFFLTKKAWVHLLAYFHRGNDVSVSSAEMVSFPITMALCPKYQCLLLFPIPYSDISVLLKYPLEFWGYMIIFFVHFLKLGENIIVGFTPFVDSYLSPNFTIFLSFAVCVSPLHG